MRDYWSAQNCHVHLIHHWFGASGLGALIFWQQPYLSIQVEMGVMAHTSGQILTTQIYFK